jgi:hypothetical protein
MEQKALTEKIASIINESRNDILRDAKKQEIHGKVNYVKYKCV